MSEDNSWVFDSLVCFLHGPIWNAPLQTFIEDKSSAFDPNQQQNENDDEINRLHSKIYEEYKTLVDYMLGSFMDEMQISPEQFEFACLEGRVHHQQTSSPENPFNFHQGIFQQIWAANDIKIFKRMMTQRNIELQLQALDLIERKQNSSSLSEDETCIEKNDEKDEENKKILVQKLSNEDMKINEKNLNETVDKKTMDKTNDEDNEDPNAINADGEKFERLNLFFKHKQVDPEQIQARQEYLRQQRDRILEIKKKARSRQLNETVKKIGRPSSAQIAQKILEGKNVNDIVKIQDNDGSSTTSASFSTNINSAASELRKTLAKRLKIEVVEQQK